MGHYELGLALFETGDWKAAAPEFEAAVTRAPRWADAHFSLAAVYARIDRVPKALTELDSTLASAPVITVQTSFADGSCLCRAIRSVP